MFKKTGHIILFTLVSIIGQVQASPSYFYMDEPLEQIYKKILELNIEEARTDLDLYRNRNPSNLSSTYIENYLDFYEVFISEEYSKYKSLEANKNKRLARIKTGDQDSPYYLLTQAEILLQWALIRFKFGENLKGFFEINQAIGLLQRNEKKFPAFIENKKSLSLLHALIGTIPDTYRHALAFISNIEGNIHVALEEINEVIQYAEAGNTYLFKDEAYAIKAYILSELLQKKQEALELLECAKFNNKPHPLKNFIYASIAHKAGKNDIAIRTLKLLTTEQRKVKLPYLNYMLGYYKLCRLDCDADQFLLAYANGFSGRNYIKEAYQKLAWYSIVIDGDNSKYRHAMQLCLQRGSSITDEDKYAHQEALSGVIPERTLLKARLLFDGGYYQKSLDILYQVNTDQLCTSASAEHSYRTARVYQKLGKHEKSLNYFAKVLSKTELDTHFMVCNSALQTGLIYESMRKIELAESYYERCLKLKPTQYKSSLHQKAKSGILRLKNAEH